MGRRLVRAGEAPILALLSPAKKLDFERSVPDVPGTDPELGSDTAELLRVARAASKEELARLMDLSEDLATSTWDRFQGFDGAETRSAILAFTGDVYQGLAANTLSADDLGWAQDHVRILSGLYGLLRPLDRMRPYRLEMGTKLANPRGKDLYAFWRDVLAARIDEAVAGQADRTVVNLASDEYFSAVDRKALRAPVVTPVFQDTRDGRSRSLFLFVKRARGAMVRWAIEHRVDRAEGLKDAEIDGYRFAAEASEGDRWVFRRPQPPPVAVERAARRAAG
jgi:cytoplasmic iron level regulating protein YaaA (DUF328/UPF0246 family)